MPLCSIVRFGILVFRQESQSLYDVKDVFLVRVYSELAVAIAVDFYRAGKLNNNFCIEGSTLVV